MVVRERPWPQGTPCWVEVGVDDPVRLAGFYRRLFGWEFIDHGPDYQHYLTATLDGRPVADIGPRTSGAAGTPTAWLTCLAVDDADSATGRAVAAGGRVVLAPATVGSHGRFAVLADPAGASFGIWQAGQYIGAQVTGVSGAAVWYDCASTDVATAGRFYERVFGCRIVRSGTNAVLTVDGVAVAGLRAAARSSWTVTFQVDDLDVALARVVELGGTLITTTEPCSPGAAASVTDPVGTGFVIRQATGLD